MFGFWGVKILKFFNADPGSWMETVRIRDPGWKKVGPRIRDKHPGSATLGKKFNLCITERFIMILCVYRRKRRRSPPQSRAAAASGAGSPRARPEAMRRPRPRRRRAQSSRPCLPWRSSVSSTPSRMWTWSTARRTTATSPPINSSFRLSGGFSCFFQSLYCSYRDCPASLEIFNLNLKGALWMLQWLSSILCGNLVGTVYFSIFYHLTKMGKIRM